MIFKASCVTDSSESSGSPGGGIQNYQSNIEISGGEISYNEANSGGGVSVTAYVSVVFSGGTVKENKAASWGGGITVSDSSNTSFIISGSASVPYGVTESGTLVKAPCKNDVHLASMYGSGNSISSYAVLKVGSNLTASGNVAAITLEHWRRGLQFLGVDGALTALDDTIIGKFDFTDKGWDKKKYTKTATNDAAKIDADIYVAGSNPAKCKTSDGASAPADTGNTIGNWAHPFASISAALSSGLLDASHDTIIVDGTVSGAQSISGTGSLSAVAIKGYKAAGATSSSAKINAGGTSGAGSALTVNADGKTVTIQDLTITGGNATDGGGINITKGSVALGTGAKVTGNIASEFGGGVYLYGSDAKLFMYDSSLIGDDATSTTIATDGTSAGSTTFANKAVKHGGGIYNNGGAVYIGYSGLSGGNPVKCDMTNGGGVRRNISTTSGYHAGGILNRNGGTVRIASGSISYNFSTTHGGGLYNNNDAGEVLIEEPQNAANKVVFEGNHAKGNGGAIFNRSSLSMSAGQIGGSTNGLQNTVDSGAKGGAIFQDGSFTISDSAVVYAGSETVNDVCLGTAERTVAVGSLSGSGTVASITPASWSRGTNILSATSEISSDVYNRFVLSKDNAGWDRANNNAESTKYVFITSPIYVVDATDSGNTRPTGFNKGVTTGANGTKTSPYASVAEALACADLATVKEITVAGTLKGAQTISATSISELKLKGYKASGDTVSSAKIDAGGANGAGSALTVNKSGLTVTITDLTITGGSGSSMTVGGAAQTNGGGILLNAGTVKLSDGAVITGNAVANNGGGVYLSASGCALYMSGKALIGDSATSTTRASSAANNRANQAANGAGIYNNGGSVFIGSNTSGTAASGYSLVNDDTNGHYGVRRNYSTTSGAGAGIYHAGGTLKIASGDISNNNAGAAGAGTCNGGGVYCAADVDISGGTFKNNYAANGGGLYIATGKKTTVNGAAVFTQNQSWVNGGAVYNAGEFTMSAGTIGGSDSSDANLAAGSAGLASYGGAIYQGGTFNVSGTAYVYPGSEKSNDVYLASGKSVAINGAWSGSQSSSSKMTLTLPTWTRGTQVLDGSSSPIKSYYTYFACSDPEFKVGYYVSGTVTADAAKVIGADIWVASSLSTGHNRTTGVSAPPTTASERKGTKAAPYATITEAVGSDACWSSAYDFTIKVTGKVNTTSRQEIASTVTAKSITITGARGNTYDEINRGLTATANKGNVLKIATAVPVTIKDLKITGGYSTNTLYDADGGGIYVSAKGASLTLGSGALITGNTSTNGGGVSIAGSSESGGKANLYMISGAQVSGNKAASAGGGVYLSYANLCMTGTALVGSTADSAAATATDGDSPQHSNWASNGSGGGVYASNGGVYMGYKTASTSSSAEESLSNGIGYNYANQNGGGLFLASGGVLYMKTGYIRRNGTIINALSNGQGGGVCVYDGATVSIQGGTIGSNAATQGGGIYFANNNTVAAGTISGNTASASGGGIYIAFGKTVELQAVAVTGNYVTTTAALAALYGGGVHNAGTLQITGTSSFTGNYVNTSNSNAYGGAISNYNTGSTIEISGSVTMDGNYVKTTATNGKKAFGGAIYNGGTLTMSAGTIGTSSLNYVTASSGSTAQGGAIYQYGTFNARGALNFNNSGNAATKNDVYIVSASNAVNITGPMGSASITVTPYSYAIGIAIARKDGGCNIDVFKSAIKKFKLVTSGIYSGVEYQSKALGVYEGAVGIDATTIKNSDIDTYMNGKEWTKNSVIFLRGLIIS